MPRFSLSSFLDNGDDDSDDEHENVEPPHPIGFSPGSSRYAFDDKFYDSDDDDDDYGGGYSSSVQEQIVPSSHVNTMTSPMKALVRHVLENNSQQRRIAARRDHGCSDNEQENENDIHALTRALRDGKLFGSSPTTLALSQSSPSSRSLMAIAASSQLPASYACLAQQEARIGQDMISARHRFERDHQESAKAMQALLDLNQQRADQKEARLKRQQEELEQQQAAEQQAQEELVEAQRQEEQRKRDARKKQQEEKRKAVEAKDESRRAAEAKIKAATEYISRADKLMAQLKQLRASVEPFETSKPMAKRRLAMKKIVNGRVNTLSEDVHKIRDVARDVSNAIDTSRQEDAHYKAQMDAGGAEFTAEMARGKRYFLDLLSSKVVVRVQAEGFNGQRGDGFPLAAMLAAIAVDNKDLVPVLTAHIFTVCPTAIPKLPTPSADATEEELMESLGMIKGKNGEFEAFERFLSRTEGLISIVADIMSSEPSDHTLFGGHEGAVKWLARFLSQLPAAPQSPLPLLTSPVLDAFLTGAGHMLANKHPDEFKTYLDFIINDCLPRIDEGTIGKPSATRLRKTIQGNFDGFKNKLPGRALAELYSGADSTGSVSHGSMGGGVSQPSSFGASASSSAPRNPFAAPPSSSTNAAPYPFSGGSTTTANATTAAPSPFTSSAPTATGFGSSSSSSQNQPFVGGGQHPASAPITRAPFASPFGASTTAPAPSAAPIPSPFGPGLQVSSNTAPSVFGTPFGQQQQQQQPQQQHQTGFAPATSASSGAPAGGVMGLFGGQQPAQQLSVFGNPAPTPAATTGFVFGSAAPVPSPFGNAATTGGGMGLFGQPAQAQQQQQQSPFGTPFGQQQQQQQQTGFAPAATGLFGPPAPPAPITSAFGQPAQQQSTFFGGGLGSNNAPVASPFGTAAPSSSPFGSQFGNNSAPAASPFASTASVVSSPFGGTFGSGTGQFGGGSSSNNNNNNTKAPCRFFAQGGCKYGSNCRFSHDTGFGGGGPGGGAFNSAPSPFSNFGGPRR